MSYTRDQLDRYLTYIDWDAASGAVEPGSLEHLTRLMQLQLAAVPFECLSLHYSKTHLLSLDLEDLYTKVVERGRGGYCMENNTFFAAILRSFGYDLIHAGARVSDATAGRPGGGYQGWSHMVNLVTVNGMRYLVDVGFGADGPCRPLPMVADLMLPGIRPQELKLQYKSLEQHTDRRQRMWVYCHRKSSDAPWIDAYAFTDVEFFSCDFQVMNLATMTLRTSIFTQSVICVRFIYNRETSEMEGVLIMLNDEIKTRVLGVATALQTLVAEEDRVEALEHHFGIKLTTDEQRGITGLRTELRGSKTPKVNSSS